MSIKKGKSKIIGFEDPEYLDKFYKSFGAGQSFTGRQAVQSGRALKKIPAGPPEPRKESDGSPPPGGSQERQLQASQESTED